MKPAYLECVIFCPKHAKTHLRAYTGPNNFFRLARARHKGEGERGEGEGGGGGGGRGERGEERGEGEEGGGRGEGRGGERRGGGRGEEGKGEGRGGSLVCPPPLLNPKYATGDEQLHNYIFRNSKKGMPLLTIGRYMRVVWCRNNDVRHYYFTVSNISQSQTNRICKLFEMEDTIRCQHQHQFE